MEIIECYFNKGLEKGLLAISIAFYLLAVLSGVGVIAFQVYYYLSTGSWLKYDLNNLIAMIGEDYAEWAFHPDSWIGLHEVLSKIPLSIFLFAIFYLVGFLLYGGYKSFKADNDDLFRKI